MSTISWFSIFSGSSARLIRSLMFDRNSVERRSKIPMRALGVLAGRHCPAPNLRSRRSASRRSAKSKRSASSETCPWRCDTSPSTPPPPTPPLAQQPLRKFSPPRESRHFAPQLFHRREHVALPCYPTCLALRLELRQVGPAEDERDHAPEEPPERHDGDQDFQLAHQ